MSQPKVLLLDEPSMGLAPNLVETIFDTLNAKAAIVAVDEAGEAIPRAQASSAEGYSNVNQRL